MASSAKRYRRRSGTQDACRLPNERAMPTANATPEDWEAYHQQRATTGTFDPCSLTRKTPHDNT